MLILDFSHPLTEAQRAQIEALTGLTIEEVRRIPTQFDQEASFIPQVIALADACHLSPEEWQTRDILIVPPALSTIATVLLAELHGRMGYFPAVVRIRPVADATPPRYEVAEIINLQALRSEARQRR